MTALKFAICICLLISASQGLVPLKPEEALRPPKRLPPPPAPTLPPLPYAAAGPVRSGEFNSPLSSSPLQSDVSPVPSGPAGPRETFNSPVSTPPVFRDEVRDDLGQFSIRFSNGDGTMADETGSLISTDDGWEYVITKTGSYSYISPEGIPITVKYVADEKGFHPQISFS